MADSGIWAGLLRWSIEQGGGVPNTSSAPDPDRADELAWLAQAFAAVRSNAETLRMVADFLRGAELSLGAKLDDDLATAVREAPAEITDEVASALARLPSDGVLEKQDVALEMLLDLCDDADNANDFVSLPEAPQRLLALCDAVRPAAEGGRPAIATDSGTRCLAFDALAAACQNNPKAARAFLEGTDAPVRLVRILNDTSADAAVAAKALLAVGALVRADAACLTRFVAADGVGAVLRLLPAAAGAGATLSASSQSEDVRKIRLWRKAFGVLTDVLEAVCSDDVVDSAAKNADAAVELGVFVRVACVLDDLHARASGADGSRDDVVRACTGQALESGLRLLTAKWAAHRSAREAMAAETSLRDALVRWRELLANGTESVPEGLVASLLKATDAAISVLEGKEPVAPSAPARTDPPPLLLAM